MSLAAAVERNAWIVLLIAILVILAVELSTLTIDPPINQDEVQIIDFGRASLDPSSDWALSWNVQELAPVLTQSYLSAALQELAFRLSAPSNLGPRISSLLAAVLAAGCIFGWLKQRKTPSALALLLAIIFFVDPIFSSVYRMGRVDGFAIAACLGSCWLLRLAGHREAAGRSGSMLLFGAGLLVASSPFLWVTAPVLFPLVVLELVQAARPYWQGRELRFAIRGFAHMAVPAIYGCLLGGTLLFIPFMMDREAYWQGLKTAMAIQSHAAVIQNSITDLFIVHDPGLAIAVLVCLFFYCEIGMLLAFAVAVGLIYQTMIYQPRVLYLIPYLLAIIAAAGSKMFADGQPRISRLIMSSVLSVLLLSNGGWLLVQRPYVAFQAWPLNDPGWIKTELEKHIGPGGHRVMLEAWGAYHAGRALGWKIYRAGSPVTRSEYLDLVRSMDYVILPERGSYFHVSREQLTDIGFVLHAEIDFTQSEKEIFSGGRISSARQSIAYANLTIYRNGKTRPSDLRD